MITRLCEAIYCSSSIVHAECTDIEAVPFLEYVLTVCARERRTE